MNQYAGCRLDCIGSYELVSQAKISGEVSCGRFLSQECVGPSFQKKWVPLPDHVRADLPTRSPLSLYDHHSQRKGACLCASQQVKGGRQT
jgi:hypothetical protein